MTPEQQIQVLREEIRRVTEERDMLKKSILSLLAEKYPLPSEEELRKEIEEIQRNPIAFDDILAEVKTRMGLAS
jgi:hypothetical protein